MFDDIYQSIILWTCNPGFGCHIAISVVDLRGNNLGTDCLGVRYGRFSQVWRWKKNIFCRFPVTTFGGFGVHFHLSNIIGIA